MNKKLLLKIICLYLLIQVSPCLGWGTSSSPETQRQDSYTSKSVLQDAMALVDIYYKIRRISGQEEGSQLKPYLDQLNEVLDKVLVFQESFTPEKKAKVLRQLDEIRGETEKLTDVPPSKMKAQITKLTDEIWKLTRTLLE